MLRTTCYTALAAGMYLPKFSSRNRRTKYHISFKLTVIEQRQLVVLLSLLLTSTDSTPCYSVFTVDFEHVIASLVCKVCETQNFLTSQYTVYLEISFNRNLYHTETSQVI